MRVAHARRRGKGGEEGVEGGRGGGGGRGMAGEEKAVSQGQDAIKRLTTLDQQGETPQPSSQGNKSAMAHPWHFGLVHIPISR